MSQTADDWKCPICGVMNTHWFYFCLSCYEGTKISIPINENDHDIDMETYQMAVAKHQSKNKNMNKIEIAHSSKRKKNKNGNKKATKSSSKKPKKNKKNNKVKKRKKSKMWMSEAIMNANNELFIMDEDNKENEMDQAKNWELLINGLHKIYAVKDAIKNRNPANRALAIAAFKKMILLLTEYFSAANLEKFNMMFKDRKWENYEKEFLLGYYRRYGEPKLNTKSARFCQAQLFALRSKQNYKNINDIKFRTIEAIKAQYPRLIKPHLSKGNGNQKEENDTDSNDDDEVVINDMVNQQKKNKN